MKSIVEREPAGSCFLCGAFGQLEKHHIFGGPNRKFMEVIGKNYLDAEEEATVSDSLSGICFLEET